MKKRNNLKFIRILRKIHTHKAYAIPVVAIVLYFIPAFSPLKLSLSDESLHIYSYSDLFNNDDSKVISEKFDSSGIAFSYKVGTKNSANIGIMLSTPNANTFINLQNRSQIRIGLADSSTNSFAVTLYFSIPKYSLFPVRTTHRYLVTELTVDPGQHTYTIPFRRMQTPLWWYSMNRTPQIELPEKIPFNRCTGISFSNHSLAARGEVLDLGISSISFLPNYPLISLKLMVSLALYSILYTLLWHYVIREPRFRYSSMNISNYKDMDWEVLESCLGKGYMDPDLTLQEIAKETSLSPQKIRLLLRSHVNMTVKEYITHIRITEAERLLKLTDRPITEIATLVGYKHVSSFNHKFKEIVGMSPGSYRTAR